MNEPGETEGYGADKIVLLGVLVAALLIAHFISASRSAVLLSEPIELDGAGLSLSIPAGRGWRSEMEWKYRENSFILSSSFNPGVGRPTAQVHCRYLLTAFEVPAAKWFAERASAVDGEIVKTGQTQVGQVTIDWAQIHKQKWLFDTTFTGIARLPNRRQLDIDVHQVTADNNFGEQVFKRVAATVKAEDPAIEIISGIRNRELASFPGGASRSDFFLIRDAGKQAIGFTIDVLAEYGREATPSVQAASFLYIPGRYPQEQTAFFHSNNSFDEFSWKSETSGRAGRSATQIVLDTYGVMTVTKFNGEVKEKKYRIGTVSIPDVFLQELCRQMLDSDHKRIIVDIIRPDGKIAPTLLSRLQTQDSAGAQATSGSVLRLGPLDGRGFYENVYMDNQKRISKRLLRQESTYTLERTAAETILREFPEHAEYILSKSKTLEQEKPLD